jgi:hypothetical protein
MSTLWSSWNPCGGGVEYLHRDLASRKKRRKGMSRIRDSKIWSRVPRDTNPRKTALARASSIYKRQTRPLVREGAPQKQDRNCQAVINIWSWLTDWLTVSRNVTLTWLDLTWLEMQSVSQSLSQSVSQSVSQSAVKHTTVQVTRLPM